ncbi:prepilin peptidase [Yersinia enterocolitica]|uniref:prepilin peptidase n=1 Tax=Yersinia enterocolitica TaxID=630 RepID=UPI00094BB9C9|nr:A24 family peptidase [Yersinia enterocolitica]EKN4036021.1 prepilin peptidase [Yersinia enterocolitica]
MTIITLALPWLFAPPLFLLALRLLEPITRQVSLFLNSHHFSSTFRQQSATLLRYQWLHAAVMTVMAVAPFEGQIFSNMTSVLFVPFIYRLSLTDRLSGWLPQEFTWSCLAAGLFTALGNGEFLSQCMTAIALLLLCGSVRIISGHYTKRELLGLGDVWFTAALGAWLGWPLALLAIGVGLCGFILWHLMSGDVETGGPLGPWLGHAALLAMIVKVYDPLLMW